MTWILGSIDPLLILNLRPHETAKSMWEYLKKVYHHDHSARRFQLETDLAAYSQGTLSVQEYFCGFQNLWAEFSDIVYADVSAESLSVVQAVHEVSKRDQFLMKLRPKFESIRSNLMHRDPSPSLDMCYGALLREEQRLLTQSSLPQENAVTYAAQGKGRVRDMRTVQCYSCKDYGHIAAHCAKKFCNYYKQKGHIIKECPTRPQNRPVNAYHATATGHTSDGVDYHSIREAVDTRVISLPHVSSDLQIVDVFTKTMT
ncbi:uncharacterized protein LOC131248923 [Magnolia sinica]|uniref:uncharacterized protein LOC131248923 n=1 Tax=Magnolia sinica TaxID=86752 RepID=UPI002658F414|nr:uncharacterized protein LOC131248923 [Magnolia sinica]